MNLFEKPNLFERRFLSILEADEEKQQIKTDSGAMQAELDPGTDPATLDAQTPPQGVDQVRGAHNAAQKKTLAGWIQEVEKFIAFINGVDGNSVQSQLAAAGCDTLFEKISNSEKKRLARVAMELSSLNESLKGYLISGEEG
jgi:hypothetical protein